MLKYLLFIPISLFALEIQRDAVNAFIFTDGVAGLGSKPCQNATLFMPENANYFGSAEVPGIPFRTYIIALPSSLPPSISLENIKSETLRGKPCGAEQNPSSLQIGKPYLKDNLWRVKVNVPLVYSNGNSWNLRKKFKMLVNFNETPKGFSVGKRTLASVENKTAAAKFGIKQIQAGNMRIAQKTFAASAVAADMEGIDWVVRIGIGTENLTEMADGMYALSFDDLRAVAKSEIDGISIDNLRLFSASPDTLPEMLGEEIFPNAVEIPISVKDRNANGNFDSGDSIIFFGYGTAIWKKSNSLSGMDYYFSHSPYSFYQYFYLGAGGKRKNLNPPIEKNISGDTITWKKYARSEKDLLLRDNYFDENMEENTGKEWFWKWGVKDSTVAVEPSDFQSIRKLTGLRGDSLWLGVSFFPRRSTRGNELLSSLDWKERMEGIKFNFYFQGKKQEKIIDTIVGGSFVFASNGAQQNDNLYRLEPLNDRFDGLSIAYRYNVNKSQGDEWLFPGTAKGAVKIPVPENMQLVKTKNFIPIEIIERASNGYANDTIQSEGDTKYFLFKKDSYKKPAFVEAIPKRATSVSEPLKIPQSTEYLILTSEKLQNSAISLKQFRESGEAITKFNTTVVLAEEIYRNQGAQFSPVAIRDYIRYAKNNCPNLKYVLLAGSGNYDYRKIKYSRDNLIPPYEAEDTSTDDFFAVLDSGEAIRFGKYELSLAIGRLPVLNTVEFDNYVQKARDYERISNMDNGTWRNTIIFNADDATRGGRLYDNIPHTRQMEETTDLVDSVLQSKNFAIDWRKISLLQYDFEGGDKKPGAAKELLLRLNQGALFTFYYGHGNAVQWADEDLLNTSSLNNINEGKYTILGSFSCLVARFDDASLVSLSEIFVNAKSKGAIAAIGSLRESYASQNVVIAKNILEFALGAPNVLLGNAILNSKKSVSYDFTPQRYNNEKYVLLGEPVLSMPKQEINLRLDSVPDTIQALQKLQISGTASVPNGKIRIQILEGEKSRYLEQKGCKDIIGMDPSLCYATIKIPGNPIYSEELQIEDYKFSTEFITPRKLSLGDTSAQIRLWAYKPGTAGIGRVAKRGISLFGTSPYADSIKDKDHFPPSIKIYPCMRSGKTNQYAENAQVSLEIPACLDIVVEDSTGIDYREEADEGISFELSPVADSWHPWSFSEQTSKRAVTRINFGLSYDPGNYVFKVRAQDILGNIALRSIRLSLNAENKAGLADVFNAPNPMKKKGTTFYFKDLAGERKSNVSIKIFDQNGKLVKVMNNVISGESSAYWDGRDSRGRLLANGLYHYVVQNTVSSLDEGGKKKVFEKKQKLVISR
ncbi:hypothetical protein R83H12_01431 [Fibrobacteria bacterium R8-3-H12]